VKAEQKVRVRIDNIDKDKIRLSMMEKFDVRLCPHPSRPHTHARHALLCAALDAALLRSLASLRRARSCVHVCVCALLLPGNMV
jgi:hypothetical protein